MEKEQNIKDDGYSIRNQTKEEQERRNSDVPCYRVELDLSEEDKDRLKEQVFIEFEALKKEREELGLEDKWAERERQYDGELKANKTLAFNLHVHQSKIKVEAIVRAINEAFMDSDPMIDCSPRPESGRKDGFEIAQKQAEFLDFAIDEEVCPEVPFVKIARCAVKKFVGIGKLSWAFKKERRRREESYEGSNKVIGALPNGQVITVNEGLERFLKAFPEEAENHKGIIRRLLDAKKVNIVVEYKDTIDNNPKLEYIKLDNFYVRNACNYWDGLRDEHCIVERKEYTYWELLKKEDDGEFENVQDLFYESKDGDKSQVTDYMTKTYPVLEVTTYFKVKEGDEEIKIKAWFSEEKKTFHAAELFPYYGFDVDYIPFYLIHNEYGFYGDARSVMYDLKDSNIAQDALLNLALHGTYIRNMLTPIVREGSEIESMFLDNQFEAGKPLPVDDLTDDVNKAFGFVQWPNIDLNGTLALDEKLKRHDSDVTRVSDLTSGQESELDPSAPASKTIALLQQSGIGIKDYIRIFLPSFNIFAWMVLQMYYQMSNEDKKYKVVGKASAVTGENPFRSITREEMVVRTNIQARAAAFAFDKVNEKREAMAAYQVTLSDPYAAQQPKIRYKALKVILETFGARWKSIVDNDLASPEEFKKQMEQAAMLAIQKLMQQAQQQAAVTGVAPDAQQVIEAAPGVVAQAQQDTYDPVAAAEREEAKK